MKSLITEHLKEILVHFWDFEHARCPKTKLGIKSFPKEELRGFWICYSVKNLLSNDVKISFLRYYSGFNLISTRLIVN